MVHCDEFGDALLRATLPGDGRRRRHDMVKEETASLARWCGAPACTEAGLQTFAVRCADARQPISGRSLGRITPDLHIRLPEGRHAGGGAFQGGGEFLGEVKTLNGGGSYDAGQVKSGSKRAVDHRADGLLAEYQQTCSRKDQEHFGTPFPLTGAAGPLRATLDSKKFAGFAVGRVGECSTSYADLTAALAEVGLERRGPHMGAVTKAGAKATLLRRMRQRIAMVSWKGLADAILGRVQYLGKDASQLTKAALRQANIAASEEFLTNFIVGPVYAAPPVRMAHPVLAN